MVIDRPARDAYAELLRHFAAGLLTNFEYDDRSDEYISSKDVTLRMIWLAVWPAYDDCFKHRLTGKHALTPAGKSSVIRMIVFLHSDLPYEWPQFRRLRIILRAITFGLSERLLGPIPPNGDKSVWPFFRAEDLAACAGRPKLLSGRRTASPRT